jgi:hypothetical protein
MYLFDSSDIDNDERKAHYSLKDYHINQELFKKEGLDFAILKLQEITTTTIYIYGTKRDVKLINLYYENKDKYSHLRDSISKLKILTVNERKQLYNDMEIKNSREREQNRITNIIKKYDYDILTKQQSINAKHYENAKFINAFDDINDLVNTIKDRYTVDISILDVNDPNFKTYIFFIRNYYALQLVQKSGFNNICSTIKKTKHEFLANLIQTKFITYEMIIKYRKIYCKELSQDIVQQDKFTFRQIAGLINSILYYMYGFKLANKRTSNLPELQNENRHTYMIYPNENLPNWDLSLKYKKDNPNSIELF